MNGQSIYSKTARGVLEQKNGGKGLSPALLAALGRVDGRSTVDALAARLPPAERSAMHHVFAELERLQLIRVFATANAAARPGRITEEDIPSSLDFEVEELDPEEGVRAWAEARRGAQSLRDSGYYTIGRGAAERIRKGNAEILVVEDDATISMLMSLFLKRRGHVVRVAADGREAINMMDASVPDLVLLDVNLPGMNGFDILSYVRAQTLLSRMPVIMVTAQVSDADVLRGLTGGADGYIFKPFDWDNLYACIKQVLHMPD